MAKRTLRDAAAMLKNPAAESTATAVLEPPVATPSKGPAEPVAAKSAPYVRRTKPAASVASVRHATAVLHDEQGSNRQAELFYLQKQIQLQTQMVFILEDGTRIQGVVEWYDRNSIKVRGKARVLIYKAAIKYLYKAGEVGTNQD